MLNQAGVKNSLWHLIGRVMLNSFQHPALAFLLRDPEINSGERTLYNDLSWVANYRLVDDRTSDRQRFALIMPLFV